MFKKWLVFIGAILAFAVIYFQIDRSSSSYKEGFLEKDTEGLTEFIVSYFTSYDFLMEETSTQYIYAQTNYGGVDTPPTYYKVEKKALKEYYAPLFETEDPSHVFFELFSEFTQLKEEIPGTEYPHVLYENDTFHMQVDDVERFIPASELHEEFSTMDNMTINIIQYNEAGMIFQIEQTEEEQYLLFANRALTEVDMYERSQLKVAAEAGELETYYPLLMRVGHKKDFLLSPDHTFIDPSNHHVYEIAKEDLLSDDYEYVYIDGGLDFNENISSGAQRIQRIDDYIAGNKIYAREFDMNIKSIGKKAGFKTSGASISNVKYVGKDFILFYVNYKGSIVGNAGSTNVIVDFSEGEADPNIHIVDLGVH